MKKTLSAKIPSDLHDDLDEYRDTHDVSKSDATRQLLRSGLDAEQGSQSVPVWFVVCTFGLILFATAALESTNPPMHAAVGALVALGAYGYAVVQRRR